MSCVLYLKKVRREPNERRTDFYLRRKHDFEQMISKDLYYHGFRVVFNKINCGIDECFEKFVIGSEKFHITKNPDFRRLERLEWIYEIINSIQKCEKCCGYLERAKRNKKYIYCIEKRYLIVLKRVKNYYIIITAFYASNGKKMETKLINLI